ncbi:MAG TPA: cobalamin-independent methionine synthase II family protein [Allosphingosinicella sp.]|nr:cobalamin-independent methionine synthase II family protein [Allosphingosinicella sp.]
MTRIRTTHVGSLPDLEPLDPDAPGAEARLSHAVEAVVARQREIGLDVINEGEYTKGGGWVEYAVRRLDGFEQRAPVGPRAAYLGKDREEFADFYRYAAERGTLFFRPGQREPDERPIIVCSGPVSYKAEAALAREVDLLKRAAGDAPVFMTSVAPSSYEVDHPNAYYATDEEYLFALAEAMRVEYETIARAGVLVQVDDAWLPALWDRIGMAMGLDAFRKRCALRVEALNHALANVPEEMIRYHLCWGSWHGPHAHDLEMAHLVDIMLSVKAKYYLFEAANARHEHEYDVWETVTLPEGKVIVPGCITHSTDVIEHPDLVAQRIRRFADRVGAAHMMAGADCGFGGRTHPQIAWAKLSALTEGAKRASDALALA